MVIAVASRSFCGNPALVAELRAVHPSIRLNETGRVLAGAELIAFLGDSERAITGLEIIDVAILSACPRLRHISKYGVGLDMIDFSAFEKHGVTLGWTPGVNCQAVAELALGFFLTLFRGTDVAAAQVRAHEWKRPAPSRELSGKTIGVVGCGHVGRTVIELLRPFRCEVLVHDIRDRSEFIAATGARAATLDEILAQADLVTFHVPRNATTIGMIGAAELARMKTDAFVVNTARGGIVDEAALRGALARGKLGGAALDVLEVEPPVDWSAWEGLRVLLTPHLGAGTEEAMCAMGRAAIANLDNRRPARDYLEYA